MSNRRTRLNGLHREISLRVAGALPPLSPRSDVPLSRLSIAQLDEASAGLLPKAEPAWCIYCGDLTSTQATTFPYCSAGCAARASEDR